MKFILLLIVFIGGTLAQFYTCPEGWLTKDNRCYQFVHYPIRNYDDAAYMCQKNGAILLSVETIQENDFVADYLKRADKLHYQWYTSGERDPSSTVFRYVWTATNKEVPLQSNMWVTPQEPFNMEITRDILVYRYDDYRRNYGLAAVSDRTIERPYICEISRNEVFRININMRDFGYGVPDSDWASVPRGPKFLLEASSTVVISDEAEGQVYMECRAFGIPQPNYQWFQNTTGGLREITSALDTRYTITNGKFTIENPYEEKDAGIYQCRVENTEGAIVSAPAMLSFATLGEFPNIDAADVTPPEFQGAVIECPYIPSTFSQAIVYQWKRALDDTFQGDFERMQRSDVRPDLNKHIFVSGNGKLYFSEVTDADNYYYYCIATLTTLNLNQNFISTAMSPSRTSKPIRLHVYSGSGGNYKPEIQDSFINVVPSSPVVGMNITLECFAYGTLPLRYSWTVPQSVEGHYTLIDDNRVLKIDNVQQDYSGQFSCNVQGPSSVGSKSDRKNYTLYVESKPEFIGPLSDQHLDVGTKQLTWRCEARAVPFPVYTWYKNGERLYNSTNGDRIVDSNTLFLRNLNQERDAGMYQCVAENSHGVTSTTAQLRILSVKPTFDKFAMNPTMSGASGGNITIECRPEAAPFPEIIWLKNGGNLNPGTDSGSRLQLTIEGDLKIKDMNAGDAGMYTCVAKNELGEARNSTMLRIHQSTQIVYRPQPTTVLKDRSAFLRCQASHNRELDLIYMWAFNGRIINFNDVERSYHYRRGNQGDNEGGLYINFAQFNQSGTYTCIAQSQVDQVNASAFLRVNGPPEAPAGLQVFKTEQIFSAEPKLSDAVLRWTDPIETHGSPIFGYDIYGKSNYSTNWTLLNSVPHMAALIPGGDNDPQRRQFVVQNLKPGSGYRFKMRSKNDYGVSAISKETETIVIPGAKPTKPPTNVGGGGGSVGTLTIRWDPLLPEDQHGWGIGYEVDFRKRPPPGQEQSNTKWEKIIVMGNIGHTSALVGKENFYLLYQVKVTPFNMFGMGNPAINDNVYSAEDMPTSQPTNVLAEPYNETALNVYWDGIDQSRAAMKGKLLGYKIAYWETDKETARQSQDITQIENRQNWKQAIVYGDVTEAMIIGLRNNSWYTVMVTPFNSAGMGEKSGLAHQKTDKRAPMHYPVHLKITPNGLNSIKVRFRGVSTGVDEEPLLGYKIKYWRDTNDIRNATVVDLKRNTEGILYQLQNSTLYHMRAMGYSMGGEGKMSSPETLFYFVDNRMYSMVWDPTTTHAEVLHYGEEGGVGAMATTINVNIATITLSIVSLFFIV
ncbi:Contactin-3 [Mactra antiquata]